MAEIELRQKWYYKFNAAGEREKILYYPLTHVNAVFGLKEMIQTEAGGVSTDAIATAVNDGIEFETLKNTILVANSDWYINQMTRTITKTWFHAANYISEQLNVQAGTLFSVDATCIVMSRPLEYSEGVCVMNDGFLTEIYAGETYLFEQDVWIVSIFGAFNYSWMAENITARLLTDITGVTRSDLSVFKTSVEAWVLSQGYAPASVVEELRTEIQALKEQLGNQ